MTATPEESEEVREVRQFFEAISPSERRRLYMLFMEMMGKTEQIQERDWRDYEPEGLRRAPKVRMAANGQ